MRLESGGGEFGFRPRNKRWTSDTPPPCKWSRTARRRQGNEPELTGEALVDAKLTAALACAAALALGACSGGNPPASVAPKTEMAGPETPETETETPDPGTGVPEPSDPVQDGRTEAERFDDDLAEAEADLAAARNRVAAAVAAAGGTGASADIAAARKALTDALAAARALRAPPDDSGRIARVARLALKASAAEAEDLPRLRAAASSAGWAGSSALVIGRESLRPVPEIPGDPRTNRRNADGTDKATLLTEEKIPAVPYEEGKIVMSPGLASSGDRLRMRGIPVVIAGGAQVGDNRLFLYMGPFFTPFPYLDPVGGGNDGVEPRTVAGLRITPGGLVVDMGGMGAPGLDFRLPSALAGGFFVTPNGSNGGYDLKLEFGSPTTSPEGSAEHYWTAALMPTPEHVTALGNRLGDGQELGVYTMRLSNHIGLDRNLEYPGDPAAYTLDDVNRYLSHAAYGHMEFSDSFALVGGTIVPGRRTFPFHVGYDAFKEEAGMRTTDVAEADKITGGTFRGRTLASQFSIANFGTNLGNYPQFTGANYLRLRGDVTLTATISGTAADNRISGKIENLESFSSGKGIWEDYARISGALTLQATGIDASGEFKGVVDTASLPAFAEGGYRGNFYGPPSSLEAAGIWYLQDGVASTATADNLSIVGSFGAALVREDGSYGVEVGPGG